MYMMLYVHVSRHVGWSDSVGRTIYLGIHTNACIYVYCTALGLVCRYVEWSDSVGRTMCLGTYVRACMYVYDAVWACV